MTAGVDGSVEPDDAALDNLRDRRPGVFGDGVPVPAVDHARRRTRSGACPVTGIRILLSFADNSGAAQMRPTIHKSTQERSERRGTSRGRCGVVGDGTAILAKHFC